MSHTLAHSRLPVPQIIECGYKHNTSFLGPSGQSSFVGQCGAMSP